MLVSATLLAHAVAAVPAPAGYLLPICALNGSATSPAAVLLALVVSAFLSPIAALPAGCAASALPAARTGSALLMLTAALVLA